MNPDRNEPVVLVTIFDFDEIYFMHGFWAQNNDSEVSFVEKNFVRLKKKMHEFRPSKTLFRQFCDF